MRLALQDAVPAPDVQRVEGVRAERTTAMLYAEWVSKVLGAANTCEDDRTRLVGLPVPGLCDDLGIAETDSDAIGDAVYDLEVIGLARQRPNDLFNLTPAGRQAATTSIEEVCGETLRAICTALTNEERLFVQTLMARSETEYDRFARLRYVDVDLIFEQIGLDLSHEQQEGFLLPLVEKGCIDYREFKTERDARPLFTAVLCKGL